ncbi:MAG: NAD(P)H-dependent oxidoreductase, partial [Campylobacterales bacterium]|nr:NAD(P)H-dependent oxidoreductase [Campylobacterales bacterium]
MKNVLLLTLHQKYDGIANGNVTRALVNNAKTFFEQNGFETKQTVIEDGYDIKEELEKFKWADIIFVQSPVYWMGLPWLGKKYIDEIFSAGAGTVTYTSDGRTRSDPSKTYGSGGLMGGKKYMLSFTYNCPKSEFDNPNGFFDGLSLDEANVALHKTFQFCGAAKLPSFAVYDIYKSEFSLDNAVAELT